MEYLEQALVLTDQGKLQQAVQVLQANLQSATLKAGDEEGAQAWHLLSLLLQDLGQDAASLKALEAAYECYCGADDIGQELNLRYQAAGLWDKSEAVLASLYERNKNQQSLAAQLSHALYMQGKREDALVVCNQALQIGGQWDVQLLSNRSMLHAQLGDVGKAKEDALAALALQPDFISARLNLALAQLGLRELEACVQNCDWVLAREPENAAALMNAALAEMEMKQQAQAQLRLKKLLQAYPEHLQALEQLIISCYHTLDEAGTQRYLNRRLALAHDLTGRWLAAMASIPLMPQSLSEARQARRQFMRDLAQLNDWVEKNQIVDTQGLVVQEGISPFYYLYHGINDKALLGAYGQSCVRLLSHIQSRVSQGRALAQPGSKQKMDAGYATRPCLDRKLPPLRLGVVSSHIRSHAIWQDKIKGLYHCRPEDVEIYTFAIESQEDEETRYAQKHSAYFERGGWRLETWAKKIAEQELDAIYYPEIGLSAQVFRLACLRLAPVQMTSWGNPLTSGLPTIDHFVSAQVFEDEDVQSFYTEQVHLLEGFPSYYERYQGEEAAFDGREFGLDFSKKLLLCAGTAFKYQFDFAEHYADIAAANEGVQLVFFAYDKEMFGRVKARLEAVFSARAIERSKLVFMPWLSRAQYQYLMRKSYLLLDSLGFSGINTVLQALEVDLPVVTMRGEMLRGRLGSGVLEAVGLDDWVVHTRQAYVEQVSRLVKQAQLRDLYLEALCAVRDRMFHNCAPVDAFYAIVRKVCVQDKECSLACQ